MAIIIFTSLNHKGLRLHIESTEIWTFAPHYAVFIYRTAETRDAVEKCMQPNRAMETAVHECFNQGLSRHLMPV